MDDGYDRRRELRRRRVTGSEVKERMGREQDVAASAWPAEQSEIATAAERLRLLVDAVEEYAIFLLAPDGTVMTWNPGAQRLKGYAAEEIVGRSFEVFYPPEDVAAGKPVRELDEATRTGSYVDDGWRLHKDGTRFWAHVVITALRDGAALRGFAKVTRDDTAARAAAARGRAVQEITSALLDGVDAHSVLALVARHAREITGAARSWLATPDSSALVVRASDGDAPGPRVGDRLVDTVEARVAATGGAEFVDDLSAAAQATGDPHGLGAALVVPLVPGVDADGVLVVAAAHAASPFRRSDLELLQTFATQAAVVLRYAQAQRALRTQQLGEDRERIARDLHDHVIQQLFATGMTLQSAALRAANPEVRGRLEEAVDRLDETIRRVRTTIFELYDRVGTGTDSVRAQILDLLHEAARALGYQPSLHLDGPVDTAVAPTVSEHMLAVLREMLSNLARHARATGATVSVSVGDHVTVRVVDDGMGPPDDVMTGNGLRNMQARAEALGGTFALARAPGSGTVATWQVPLARGG